VQDMVEAEKAAKAGKKLKKKKEKKKKKKGKKGKKGKKKKDPTADRPLESLYVEMVSQGILVHCPKVRTGAVQTFTALITCKAQLLLVAFPCRATWLQVTE
jgi:hypothetical protein